MSASDEQSINVDSYQHSRASSKDKLSEFLPRLSEYASMRNYETKDLQNVSGLSPFINYRALGEWEVLDEVLKDYDQNRISKFIDELFWRSYWTGWMESHPKVWEDYIENLAKLEVHWKSKISYQEAIQGETELEIFNQWNQQLIESGYLHNHARMWYASIWIFTLKLPWQLGANHFLKHLLDGSESVNTLSWRWVAGLQTKGKAYFAREQNIKKYSFRSVEGLRSLEIPSQLSIQDHETFPLVEISKLDEVDSVLNPSLFESPMGLVLFPSDLIPEIGELHDAAFSSIAIFEDLNISKKLHSSVSHEFYKEIERDAIERISNHWYAEIVRIDGAEFPSAKYNSHTDNVGLLCKKRLYSGAFDDWVASVVGWAKQENLRSVCWYEPPIGYERENSKLLKFRLEQNGIVSKIIRRKWDELTFVHCQKGFFQFKKKIPSIMPELLDYYSTSLN